MSLFRRGVLETLMKGLGGMVLSYGYTWRSIPVPMLRQYPKPTKSVSLRVGPGVSVVKPLHVIPVCSPACNPEVEYTWKAVNEMV